VSKAHAELARRLDYHFKNPELLQRALTHRSKSAEHYERLEFLGDSVLNLVVSNELYDRYPSLPEGDLTRLRASLVRKQTLAELARGLELGRFLELGSGELKSGGFERDSILADTFEAVIGAVYKDGGLEAAAAVVRRLYGQHFERLDPRSVPKDPKTRLQEYLQKQSLPTPTYSIVDISGEPHAQQFVVECRVAGLAEPVRGSGKSRRAAEQEAAARALERLTRHP
jgi:ribonuclease-3